MMRFGDQGRHQEGLVFGVQMQETMKVAGGELTPISEWSQ